MRHFLLRIEPIVWVLFGAGILLGTLLLPGYLLTVALGGPLGFVPKDALSWERMHMIAASIPGRIVLLGLIALPLWKGAHHLRSFSIDFRGWDRDPVLAPLLYAIAAAGSLLALVAVIRL